MTIFIAPYNNQLRQSSLSITGQTHDKLMSICFFTITNCQTDHSHSLPHRIKLVINSCVCPLIEHARICAVIIKMVIALKLCRYQMSNISLLLILFVPCNQGLGGGGGGLLKNPLVRIYD